MISHLIKNLNKKQKEAVISEKKNLLILAGAGSGKTKVLVHRIAWLLKTKKSFPEKILAVTFTNKAALEIKNRIEKITEKKQKKIWIGTFHSLSYRFLKKHYSDADLPKNFQIIDNEDQIRILKKLIKNLNLDLKIWNPNKILSYINKKKDKGIKPESINYVKNETEKNWLKIYKIYQKFCDKKGLLDFSELLLRTCYLLNNKPKILNFYQNRFNNILVDEFQDTNIIQYNWIRILAGNSTKTLMVGDDDQSIYGWRGAELNNIKSFLNEFSEVTTIRLEQNYRSSNNIIQASNAVIKNNSNRFRKKLWTKSKNGALISLYSAINEIDEANFIAHQIKKYKKEENDLNNFAILYRQNFQSRILEEILLKNQISYKIHGGTSFFQREEIKDVLSYSRLIVNHQDDIAFERIINKPRRGIGKKTLKVIQKISLEKKIDLYQASCILINETQLKKNIVLALKNFLDILQKIKQKIKKSDLHIQIKNIIKYSGLMEMYSKDEKYKKSSLENLKELINASYQYNNLHVQENKSVSLQDFLSHIALNFSEQNLQKDKTINLMTVHSSKGLEFKSVFLIGMEEGIFPTKTALYKTKKLEEERRLAYVAMTRAMYKLTLTYTKSRFLYNKKIYNIPSRFLKEIPINYIKSIFSI